MTDSTDRDLTAFALSPAEAGADRFTDIDSVFFDQFDAQLSGEPTPHLREAVRRMTGVVAQSD